MLPNNRLTSLTFEKIKETEKEEIINNELV